MTAAIFGLLGVIVGACLQGGVDAILERARRRSDARVAALLVLEELIAASSVLLQLRETQRWYVLQSVPGFGSDEQWRAHRAALARVLSPDAYASLGATYFGIQSASARAVEEEPGGAIAQAEGERLATTYLTLNRALTYLGRLMYRPPFWRPRARRAWDRKNDDHLAGLYERDRHYQDFMAKHGRREGTERAG